MGQTMSINEEAGVRNGDGYNSMNNSDQQVLRYAHFYEIASAAGHEQLRQTCRRLLFTQMAAYQRFLAWHPDPNTERREWSRLQNTLQFASAYAESYLMSKSPEETIAAVHRDMTEEGRWFTRGIAEWIVADANKSADQEKRES